MSTSAPAAVVWSDVRETPSMTKEQVHFTSGSTVTIQVPADKVFEIITAFDKYGEWNTWCPSFTFKQGEEIKVGSIGTMHCRMEAQERDYEIPEQILEMESTLEKHRIAWRGLLLPSWAGKAERVQEITPNEDGKSCTVTQWQSMAGWSTYILKYAMGVPKQLDESNMRYSNDLKAYAEKGYPANG